MAITDDRLVPQGEGRHLVLFFLLMTGKFYTLGIMRSLNSRPELRGRMTSDDVGRTSLSDWQWDDEHRHSDSRRSSDVRFSSSCLQCSCEFDTETQRVVVAVTQTPFLETASTSGGQRLCTLPESSSSVS